MTAIVSGKVNAKLPVLQSYLYRYIKLKLKGLIGHRAIDEYLVTSTNGKLKSKNVDLNGDELHLSSGIYVPRLHPVQSKTPLKLPPLSYAFYVVPLANARECM